VTKSPADPRAAVPEEFPSPAGLRHTAIAATETSSDSPAADLPAIICSMDSRVSADSCSRKSLRHVGVAGRVSEPRANTSIFAFTWSSAWWTERKMWRSIRSGLRRTAIQTGSRSAPRMNRRDGEPRCALVPSVVHVRTASKSRYRDGVQHVSRRRRIDGAENSISAARTEASPATAVSMHGTGKKRRTRWTLRGCRAGGPGSSEREHATATAWRGWMIATVRKVRACCASTGQGLAWSRQSLACVIDRHPVAA